MRSLGMYSLAALATAVVLAGCGNNFYFAGRTLPPSGLTNRVMIAVQNPSAIPGGALPFVDAYYDIRHSLNDKIASFSISGFSAKLPVTIQNLPEEEAGLVYASGDGSYTKVNYATEAATGSAATLPGFSSSVFSNRALNLVAAASQQQHTLTVLLQSGSESFSLSLPGVYKVSMNPGGTVVLAFAQNSNLVYYPRKLQASESTAYAGGPANWPTNAVDCEPQNLPGMCLFQIGDSSGNPYTYFDRPVKAVFSADGSQIYVLNCGAECGGSTSSITVLPAGPFNITSGQQVGTVPSAPTVIAVPGGAYNALLDSGTLYVAGEQWNPKYSLFAGNLSVVNLATNTLASSVPISDGTPGRMIEADDNSLWIASTQCLNGVRYQQNQTTPTPYGCLTMYNTGTNTVTLVDNYNGDANGLAAVTNLHKLYYTEGGQVYIRSTVDGTSINNYNVTVTGTAVDVAYMDGLNDTDNTVY